MAIIRWCFLHLCMYITATTQVLGLSTHGKHFVFGIPESRILAEYPVTRFYITTLSSESVNVTMSMPYFSEQAEETVIRRFTVQPGHVKVQEYSVLIQAKGSSIENKGILVEASADISLQVGVVNDFSSDAFLAIPTEALSNEYFVLTYLYTEAPKLGTKQGPSQFLIVATEDDTSVTLTFPTHIPQDIIYDILSDLNVITQNDKNTRNFALPLLYAYETLQIQSDVDLCGTKVVSNAPVAVIAGAVWSSVLVEEMGDHLVEQMPPTNTWGGEFVAGPLANRTSGDIFRVLAKLNETKVYLMEYRKSEYEVIYLDEGEYKDFMVHVDEIKHVLGNKGIMLMHLSTSYAADSSKFGDPFMATVTPIEQFSHAYSFSTVQSLFDEYMNYINLITDAEDISDLLFDGERMSNDSIVDSWLSVPGTKYKFGKILVPSNLNDTSVFHSITASSNAKVGGILYGFQIQESYGMALGQTLDRIDMVCVQVVHEWADLFDNDCDGLIDEEISNGVDDDGDGVVDEDVYNDKTSRLGSSSSDQSNGAATARNDSATATPMVSTSEAAIMSTTAVKSFTIMPVATIRKINTLKIPSTTALVTKLATTMPTTTNSTFLATLIATIRDPTSMLTTILPVTLEKSKAIKLTRIVQSAIMPVVTDATTSAKRSILDFSKTSQSVELVPYSNSVTSKEDAIDILTTDLKSTSNYRSTQMKNLVGSGFLRSTYGGTFTSKHTFDSSTAENTEFETALEFQHVTNSAAISVLSVTTDSSQKSNSSIQNTSAFLMRDELSTIKPLKNGTVNMHETTNLSNIGPTIVDPSKVPLWKLLKSTVDIRRTARRTHNYSVTDSILKQHKGYSNTPGKLLTSSAALDSLVSTKRILGVSTSNESVSVDDAGLHYSVALNSVTSPVKGNYISTDILSKEAATSRVWENNNEFATQTTQSTRTQTDDLYLDTVNVSESQVTLGVGLEIEAENEEKNAKKLNSWDKNLKMVVIPVAIVFGVPFFVCCCICLRLFCSSIYNHKKTKRTINVLKQNDSVATLSNNISTKKYHSYDTKTVVTQDCRQHFSKECKY